MPNPFFTSQSVDEGRTGKRKGQQLVKKSILFFFGISLLQLIWSTGRSIFQHSLQFAQKSVTSDAGEVSRLALLPQVERDRVANLLQIEAVAYSFVAFIGSIGAAFGLVGQHPVLSLIVVVILLTSSILFLLYKLWHAHCYRHAVLMPFRQWMAQTFGRTS